MKTLHLICNSHIDPVWQWDWDDGKSTALATFYSAVKLAKEYDYIFCHNEVYLYEIIEKHDPKLFKEITELIKQNKWHVMGGWYIQPDCMVPSGESFIRQISLGKEYFISHFNYHPTTAINFDAFAHTRGLPSVLKKSGYDSYFICRPMPEHDLFTNDKLPQEPFLWQGYDGSKIKVARQISPHLYNSISSKVKESILEKFKLCPNEDNVAITWGVGNHGGGASKKDLEDILVLQEEKKNEYKIIHSTFEDYFKTINPTKIVNRQLITFYKSYSSCNAIKAAHDNLENALYRTEKICSLAELQGEYKYNKKVLKDAERALCQIEFHDVLSGTAIKRGTDSSIQRANHAIDELNDESYLAFNALAKHLPSAPDGYSNFAILNHNPYQLNGLIEIPLYKYNSADKVKEYVKLTIYDKDNNIIPHQQVKAESEINFDRATRVLMKVSLPASSVSSFSVKEEICDFNQIKFNTDEDIIIKDNKKTIKISKSTGLLESFIYEGKEYLKGPSFVPTLFNDNDDPWGWNVNRFDEKYDLVHKEYEFSNAFKTIKIDPCKNGIFNNLKSVTLLEDGELVSIIQALFTYHESHIIVLYKIYKNENYIDVNTRVIWNEKNKGLKIKFNLNSKNKCFAQAAFGQEFYKGDKQEYPMNRYVGIKNKEDDKAFVIYNKSGIHSMSKAGNNLYLTLLNGATYCAHPTGTSQILPDLRRFPRLIEIGEREFDFRIAINDYQESEKIAKEFNEPIYGVPYYPHGDNIVKKEIIKLSNSNIVITALKTFDNGKTIIRLYNGSKNSASTTLKILESEKEIKFKKFEFITLSYYNKKINIEKDAAIYQ